MHPQNLTYSAPHRRHAYRFTRTQPVSGFRGGSWMITNIYLRWYILH